MRRLADRQETKVSKSLGCKKTAGSGCAFNAKGDFVSDIHRGECKITGHEQITMKRVVLDKITDEALKTDKKPCLVFGFNFDEDTNKMWVAIPFNDFVGMYYE